MRERLMRELNAVECERAMEWRPNQAAVLDAHVLRLRSELAALDAVVPRAWIRPLTAADTDRRTCGD